MERDGSAQNDEESDYSKARDAFILVLIDGDGMIFDDRFVQNGEAGGREAAGLLWNAVMDHFQSHPGLPSDVKIVTRIYANLKGLGDVFKKSGILSTPSTMEDFARGFTGSKQLFDFVDVGVGKAKFVLFVLLPQSSLRFEGVGLFSV